MVRDTAREGDPGGTGSNRDESTPVDADGDGGPDDKSPLNRRAYLRLGTVAAASTVGVGATSAGGSARNSYEQVVDAVEDLGWDPTGSVPVDDALGGALQDGTLVTVPPGTYRLTESQVTSDLSRWGLRGTGSDPADVRFVAPEEEDLVGIDVGGTSRDVALENVSFVGAEGGVEGAGGAIGLDLSVQDGLHVADVAFAGSAVGGSGELDATLALAVTHPAGSGVVAGVGVAGIDGAEGSTADRDGLLIDPDSRGTVLVRDSTIEACAGHGLRAAATASDVLVANCRFADNGASHVRLGGAGSVVRDSAFVRAGDSDGSTARGDDAPDTTDDLVFTSGGTGASGGTVEGCTFDRRAGDATGSCLVVAADHGGMTVRDSSFRVDDGAVAIRAADPSQSVVGADGESLRIAGVAVVGTGGTEGHPRPAISIVGREDPVVTDTAVSLEAERDGVALAAVTDGVVADAPVDVPGEALVLRDASATTTNLSGDGAAALDDRTAPWGGEQVDETGEEQRAGLPPRELAIVGTAGGRDARYGVTVSGALSAVGNDDVDGTFGASSEGLVGDGDVDRYRFSGVVTDVTLTGPAELRVDGEQVDPGSVVADRQLTVAGTGEGTARYAVAAKGAFVAHPDDLGDRRESVARPTASGSVGRADVNRYLFGGDVTGFSLDGTAAVSLDGERVDAEALAAETDAAGPHRILVDGTDTTGSTEFAFAATGVSERSRQAGTGTGAADGLHDGDDADGQVSGTVADDVVGYRFAGDVLRFEATGDASVAFGGVDR